MSYFEAVKIFFTETPETSTASLVDNHLVVSLVEAKDPVVWRVNFDDIRSALFSIVKKGAVYQLIMEDKKESRKDVIASFDDHETAKRAHYLISKALLSDVKTSMNTGWIQNTVIFLVFFILLYWVMSTLFADKDSIQNASIKSSFVPAAEQEKIDDQAQETKIRNVEKGVPLSVDDLLGR